jgi:hypothetical protein
MNDKLSVPLLVSAYVEKILGVPFDILRASDHLTGDSFPVHIHCFADQPCEGATTCCTIGLSEKLFSQDDGTSIRFELLFTAYVDSLKNELNSHFFSVVKWLMQKQEMLLSGEILDMEEPLAPGSEVTGFWFYAPIYFPDELNVFDETEPNVIFVWAIPVSAAEMSYLEQNGPDAFSELLEKQDPDLIDIYRPSVKLG